MNNKPPVTPLLLYVTILGRYLESCELANKKCVTEATHRKTQTPIVAKQSSNRKGKTLLPSEWSCAFTELISDDNKKRVQHPLGIKLSFSLFCSVWL